MKVGLVVVYVPDVQNTFDTVNHKILLQKLEYYGTPGVCNDWFKSGCHLMTADCDLTQGYVLLPLLFLIYKAIDLHIDISRSPY